MDAATSTAVVPATSFARHTQRFVSAVAGLLVDPAGRLHHGEVRGRHRRVGPPDPGPYGRQVPQLAGVDVLHRGVDRGPGHAHVDGGVAGHHPVRDELGHHQGQALHAAEQRARRDGDVDVQVV